MLNGDMSGHHVTLWDAIDHNSDVQSDDGTTSSIKNMKVNIGMPSFNIVV